MISFFLFEFQHALLLPVLVHHVRYHLSLQTFDEKIGYVFKDRSLLRVRYSSVFWSWTFLAVKSEYLFHHTCMCVE
jgi:hypothetical protein